MKLLRSSWSSFSSIMAPLLSLQLLLLLSSSFWPSSTRTSSRMTVVMAQQQQQQQLVGRSLGYIRMEFESTENSDTNELLRKLLAVSVSFLDGTFYNNVEPAFHKVSCSIHSYTLGGMAGDPLGASNERTAVYMAIVTVTGQALFKKPVGVDDNVPTQEQVLSLVSEAFDDDQDQQKFLQALSISSDPFLSNVDYISVKVDGMPPDMTTAGSGVAANSDNNNTQKSNNNGWEVWMIALAAGGGAFVLVLCVIVACIWSVPLDDEEEDKDQNTNEKALHELHKKMNITNSQSLPCKPTVGTKSDEEEDLEMMSKTPSPVRSITSQDSSVFTYNPKSSRSRSNSYSSNNQRPPLSATNNQNHMNSGNFSTTGSISSYQSTAADLMNWTDWQSNATSSPGNDGTTSNISSPRGGRGDDTDDDEYQDVGEIPYDTNHNHDTNNMNYMTCNITNMHHSNTTLHKDLSLIIEDDRESEASNTPSSRASSKYKTALTSNDGGGLLGATAMSSPTTTGGLSEADVSRLDQAERMLTTSPPHHAAMVPAYEPHYGDDDDERDDSYDDGHEHRLVELATTSTSDSHSGRNKYWTKSNNTFTSEDSNYGPKDSRTTSSPRLALNKYEEFQDQQQQINRYKFWKNRGKFSPRNNKNSSSPPTRNSSSPRNNSSPRPEASPRNNTNR